MSPEIKKGKMAALTSDALHRSKEEVLEAIRQAAIIPVVRVNDSEEAICSAEGMIRAKHPILELTLTVPNALKTIEKLTRRFGSELIVGAGTVLTSEECNAAILAGAQFIVSPSTNVKVIEMARSRDVVSIPGAFTPTDVATALAAEADLIKIFPADTAGGPRYIRTLSGPFPQARFVPSGGVEMSNIVEYFSCGVYAVAIGSLIFDRKALSEKRVDVLALNVQRFVAAAKSANKPNHNTFNNG